MNSKFAETPPMWHGTSQLVSELADMTGGTVLEEGVHPGGDSGFAILSMELPKDHWIYEVDQYDCAPEPVPTMLVGGRTRVRKYLDDIVRDGIRNGVRVATRSGREQDFDPDVIVQQARNGMFGVYSPDGESSPLSHPIGEPWDHNARPRLPGVVMEILRLCIADGLISYNDVVGGVQPEAVARSVAEFEERKRVEQEAAEVRWRALGIGWDEPVPDVPAGEDKDVLGQA